MRSPTASVYANETILGSIKDYSILDNEFLQNNTQECPVGSRRNAGRHGKLFHTVEFGPFYHMLEISTAEDSWRIYSQFEVNATTEEGMHIYVYCMHCACISYTRSYIP